MKTPTLNRRGRVALFNETLAYTLLENRKLFDKECTVSRFIDEMVTEKELQKACSVDTMRRLLTGKMYPDLIDPRTQKKYDYSEVPRAAAGQPAKETLPDVHEITGEPRPKFGKLRRQLVEVAGERARDVALAQIAILKQALGAREHELEQRFNAKLEELRQEMRRPPIQFVPTKVAPLPANPPPVFVRPKIGDAPLYIGDDPHAPTITCEGKASAAG